MPIKPGIGVISIHFLRVNMVNPKAKMGVTVMDNEKDKEEKYINLLFI